MPRTALGEEPATARASISFPLDLYQTLESLAKAKKVSLAWIVRDAAEKYVKDEWPLFAHDSRKSGQA